MTRFIITCGITIFFGVATIITIDSLGSDHPWHMLIAVLILEVGTFIAGYVARGGERHGETNQFERTGYHSRPVGRGFDQDRGREADGPARVNRRPYRKR
jgi:hypothetical protein